MNRTEGRSSTDQRPHILECEIGHSASVLVERLEDGYRRIADAECRGEDISAWEEFWMKLLHEYEALCDELTRAA